MTMTEEQKATLRATIHNGYIVSESKGIGLMAALEQAGEGQHVYERLGKSTSRTLDFNERLLAALKDVVSWATRGNGGLIVNGLDVTSLIAEVEAYNAAQLEIIAKYDDDKEALLLARYTWGTMPPMSEAEYQAARAETEPKDIPSDP